MAEYLIQGETLDDIADAINAKTGGSSAMTPAQMVTAIQNIPAASGWTTDGIADGSEPNGRLSILNSSAIITNAFRGRSGITGLFIGSQVNSLGIDMLSGCVNLASMVSQSTVNLPQGFAYGCTRLASIDILNNITGSLAFCNCSSLNVIVLRKQEIITLSAANSFNSTPFATGGTGGTIYIPKALYDHLGDGSSLDYKAATNWATIDAYGTITWAQIEGSIYETQYADGTSIPST